MKKSFVPTKLLVRNTNGKTFVEQAQVDGATFGLTAIEIADADTKRLALDTEIAKSVALDAQKQQQTQITVAADKAFTEIWRTLAGKMRINTNYDIGVGERYKIVGDELTIDIANSKPDLKESKVPTGWRLDFNLRGFFDGVKIYRKRPADANFIYLATDTRTPYIDTDTQVDGTQYYAYFMIGDDAVGQPSDTVTVKV